MISLDSLFIHYWTLWNKKYVNYTFYLKNYEIFWTLQSHEGEWMGDHFLNLILLPDDLTTSESFHQILTVFGPQIANFIHLARPNWPNDFLAYLSKISPVEHHCGSKSMDMRWSRLWITYSIVVETWEYLRLFVL